MRISLLEERPVPDEQELRASLTAFIWFLDRAADGGIPLTASGYLKPADVAGAAEVVPAVQGWIGKANRESDTTPVLHFRKALQALGLLRKHKGSLVLTRAGRDSQAAWQTLWNHLADRLVPNTDGFETDATLLLLLCAATSPGSELPLRHDRGRAHPPGLAEPRRHTCRRPRPVLAARAGCSAQRLRPRPSAEATAGGGSTTRS